MDSNAGWGSDPVLSAELSRLSAQVGAFAFAAGSRDSALAASLAPAGYTAVVTGAGSDRGVALIEVYHLP